MNELHLPVIYPDWPAPTNVVAFTTTTAGGVSEGDCASLNLGTHVGDNPAHVRENRRRLQYMVGETVQLCWLRQTHSDLIIDTQSYQGVVEADASVSHQPQCASVVMTADCLPVLLCDAAGSRVAALHCGWRGLCHNLIQATIQQYFPNVDVMAWLGPAIGSASYEVDEALYQRFCAQHVDYAGAFQPTRPGHYLFDLYYIARLQLLAAGLPAAGIFGGDFDTFADKRFYSHRRSAQSGRMASVIYLQS